MAKKKKKRNLGPRVKRMNRKQRLTVGRKWLEEYTGKNKVRGYCKHFAVDWRCAVVELTSFGVPISKEYIATRNINEANQAKSKAEKKAAKLALENEHWHPYTDSFEAYLAEDYAAHYELILLENGLDPLAESMESKLYGDEVPF
jgi:hypothetical protein